MLSMAEFSSEVQGQIQPLPVRHAGPAKPYRPPITVTIVIVIVIVIVVEITYSGM